jgi:hypothetical protein
MAREEGSVRGRCLCGLVRFEAELPPRFVAHCHCHNCTRAHGAGVVTWAGFDADRFRIVAGEELLTRYRTETDATRSFCADCGTTMLFESPRWAGEVHVAVANLIDPLGQAPDGHAYADRAPDWCPILDDLPRFGGESGVQPLPAAPDAE